MPEDPKWRIMVVDDDQPLLTLFVETLGMEFEVVPAVNGLDALEKIDRAEPDLIILDVAMPCVDGVDTCRAIRKNARFSDAPVLFLSGQDQSDYIERARDLGVHRFLQKPMAPAELLACCRGLIRDLQLGSPPPKSFPAEDLERQLTEATPIHPDPAEQPPRMTGPESEAETRDRWVAATGERPAKTANKAVPPDSETTPVQQHVPVDAVMDFGPNPPRVMTIDDDPDVIIFILSILRTRLEAFGVSEPISAIDKIVRFQPDLIILDVAMPHMSGFQLSQLLRLNRNLRTIKVMFASATDNPREIAYAKKLGAAEYLVKPFTHDQLLEKVAGIVAAPDFVVREKAIAFDEIVAARMKDETGSIFV